MISLPIKRKRYTLRRVEDKRSVVLIKFAFAQFLSILADLGQSFNQAHRVRLTVVGFIRYKPADCYFRTFLLGYKNDQVFGDN